jgi:phage shock protein PspC (stress-responsive transcriptional regulator)
MKRLFRKRNSDVGGVCSGIGEYLELDETIIKAIFLILIFTPVPIMLIYIFLWFIIPKEPL